MIFRTKLRATTKFSEFIRRASSEEKKRTYTRVLKKAAERQLKLCEQARLSGFQKTE
jgi:hypothetical protein